MDQQRTLVSDSQELQTTFEELLESKEVYYNPPASVKMRYPAVVYTRSEITNRFANNNVYRQWNQYEVTVISRDPDCDWIEKVSRMPRCSFVTSYVADNLYHNKFRLYR